MFKIGCPRLRESEKKEAAEQHDRWPTCTYQGDGARGHGGQVQSVPAGEGLSHLPVTKAYQSNLIRS